jgi:hypothetical protein
MGQRGDFRSLIPWLVNDKPIPSHYGFVKRLTR